MQTDCLEPRKAATLPQLIRAAAAAYGNDVAIRLKREDDSEAVLSFAELDRESAKLARGLVARGVGKGSRIGFIYGNGPDFVLMLAAIARIGAIAIPISTLIRSNELVRVLRQSDVGGVIVHREFLGHDYVARFCDALPELRSGTAELRIEAVPYLRWIVSDGDNLPPTFRDRSFLTDAADTVGEAMLRVIEAEVYPTDQMIEIYTSGSMALPKGVKHNHGPLLARAQYLQGMLNLARGKEASAQLPMFWIGGMMMYLIPGWIAGAVTVCSSRTLNNSRFSVGAVLADEDLKLLSASKPYWGLGMTETLGPYSYGDVHRVPGYPVCAPMDHWADGFEVRIVDESNQPVSDGGTGEIQVRGPAITPALHKVKREDYLTPDGFLRTGDMGLVEGARVHFVGRNGDMIKTSRSNVSPAEVEMEMQTLDGVHNAYVVGLPDDERGQLVVAAVVARDDNVTLDFAAIETKLRQRLSSYKVPRAYLQIRRDEVPMLPSNKVARREVAKLMAQRLGRAG